MKFMARLSLILCTAWTVATLFGSATILHAQVAPATRPASNAPTTQRLATARPDPERKTYVLHLPGIGGLRGLDRVLIRGLSVGGFDKFDAYDWTENNPGIPALLARERNQKQAERVARMIVAFTTKNPNVDVHLVAHSGGTGIAVWALEALPPNVTIHTLTLLASALSPDYDLSKALTHVDHKAYAFTSLNDTLVLGIGTKMFATIDGKKVEAAGRVGFIMPPDANAKDYAKFEQFPYDPCWMQFDNLGDHIGPMHSAFAAKVLAPLMLNDVHPPASPTTPATTKPAVPNE